MKLKYLVILASMLLIYACQGNLDNQGSINGDNLGDYRTLTPTPHAQPTQTSAKIPTSTIFSDDKPTETPINQISETGRLIFGSMFGARWTLYLYDLDTGRLSELIKEQFDNLYMLSSDSDGKLLAAVVNIDQSAHVLLIDLTDMSYVDLTPENAWEFYARVSPNGMMMAFSSDREGFIDVFLYQIKDGVFENLTGGSFGNCSVHAWSPDSSKILFESNDRNSTQLFILDLTTSEISSLGHVDSNYVRDGIWSPDGRYIALTVGSPPTELYLLESNGESQISLIRNEPEITDIDFISWSPDSQSIFMIANEKLYLVDAESGELEKLASGRICEGCRNPSWSSNGDFIYYIDPNELKTIKMDNINDPKLILSPDGFLDHLLWLP